MIESRNALVTRYQVYPALSGPLIGSWEAGRDVATGREFLISVDFRVGGIQYDLTNSAGGNRAVGGALYGPGEVLRGTDDFQVYLLSDTFGRFGASYSGSNSAAGYQDVRIVQTISHDPADSVDAVYRFYGGRGASVTEQTFWNSRIAEGQATLVSVRAAVLDDPFGLSNYAIGQIQSIYQDYLGRAATLNEVKFWEGQLHEGQHFGSVRAAVISDYDGMRYGLDTVRALYQEYGGRPPSSQEEFYWHNHILDGGRYVDVRTAILADPLGQTHEAHVLDDLYTAYFGRSPSASEAEIWSKLIYAGATFDTVTDTLMSDSGSKDLVRHLSGTPGTAERFDLGLEVGFTAVAGFTPGEDRIDFGGTDFGRPGETLSRIARDFGHDVVSLDGRHDVVFTFGEQDTLLIYGVTLAQLHQSDFFFG